MRKWRRMSPKQAPLRRKLRRKSLFQPAMAQTRPSHLTLARVTSPIRKFSLALQPRKQAKP
jgi:hypothetical protein